MPKPSDLINEPLSSFCTTREAAALLHINQQQAQRLAKDGRIVSIKWGHDLLIYRPSLETYKQTKSRKGRPPGNR